MTEREIYVITSDEQGENRQLLKGEFLTYQEDDTYFHLSLKITKGCCPKTSIGRDILADVRDMRPYPTLGMGKN